MYIDISSLLFSLSTALDYVEQEVVGVSHNHCRRVACVSTALCKHMGMSDAQVMDMAICSVLHDSALTETTLKIKQNSHVEQGMWKHCDLGERNVSRFPFLQEDVKNIVLWHHENWDGTGYLRLKENEISERAAILRLADNTDLLFHLGSEGCNHEMFLKHLKEYSGKLYSPRVVEAFFECATDDFLYSLKDSQINNTIRGLMPPMVKEVTTQQMLQLGCVFSVIIDSKSHFTSSHSQGVVRTAEIMANYYNFDRQHTEKIMLAAHLHDLGKLMIPATILEKAAPLTEDEFIVMQTHAWGTHELLSMVEGFETICNWASQHHEKLDGTGYPTQIDKIDLSFESRLLACIDIYQALTEDRPYRKGMTHAEAMRILHNFAASGKLETTIVNDLETVMQSQFALSWPHKKCQQEDVLDNDAQV